MQKEVKQLADRLLRASLSNLVAADSPPHFCPVAGDSADYLQIPRDRSLSLDFGDLLLMHHCNVSWLSYLC